MKKCLAFSLAFVYVGFLTTLTAEDADARRHHHHHQEAKKEEPKHHPDKFASYHRDMALQGFLDDWVEPRNQIFNEKWLTRVNLRTETPQWVPYVNIDYIDPRA